MRLFARPTLLLTLVVHLMLAVHFPACAQGDFRPVGHGSYTQCICCEGSDGGMIDTTCLGSSLHNSCGCALSSPSSILRVENRLPRYQVTLSSAPLAVAASDGTAVARWIPLPALSDCPRLFPHRSTHAILSVWLV